MSVRFTLGQPIFYFNSLKKVNAQIKYHLISYIFAQCNKSILYCAAPCHGRNHFELRKALKHSARLYQKPKITKVKNTDFDGRNKD